MKYIDQFQYPQTYDQNSEYYYSNCQNEENEPWGSPIARRPLQQYNYQYDQPIVPRVIKNRVTTTTKKVKQMVDVSSKKVLLNSSNVTYYFHF